MHARLWILSVLLLVPASAFALDVCPRTPGSLVLSTQTDCPSPASQGGGGGGSGDVTAVGTLTANRFILGNGGTAITAAPALTGLVVANGASAPTAYSGGVCTNQFVRSLNASGALVCAQVSLNTDVTGTLQAPQFPALTGHVTTSAGSLTTTIGAGVVTNAMIVDLAASKLTGTLQAAQFPALTGPVTTTAGSLATSITAGSVTNAMLAGSIDLATKVTGILPTANGGTGMGSAPDDTILMSNGSFWQARSIPSCPDTGGNHLNYDVSTNTWLCGTSTSGLTPVTAAGTLPADELIVGNGGTQVKTATAPIVIRSEDSSIQLSVTSTQNAVDYIEVQSGLSGIGATVAATSIVDTDVALGLVGQGAGCVNMGNGDFPTPLLRACSTEVSVGNVPFRLSPMTTAERDALPSPVAGWEIWNTTTSAANIYTGSAWVASGGIPGGSNAQLQYNNAGALGGIAGTTANGSVGKIEISETTLARPAVQYMNLTIDGALPSGHSSTSLLFPQVVMTGTSGTSPTASVAVAGQFVAEYGFGGVPSTGGVGALNLFTNIHGIGHVNTEPYLITGNLVNYIGTGIPGNQTTTPTGSMWIADLGLFGPIGQQPGQMNGVSIFGANFYNGSPVRSEATLLALTTAQGVGTGGATAQHYAAATYPWDVGLFISGTASSGNGMGFTRAIVIGDIDGPWEIAAAKIGTGIDIQNYVTRGLYLHDRFSGATGPALEVASTAGDVLIRSAIGLGAGISSVASGVSLSLASGGSSTIQQWSTGATTIQLTVLDGYSVLASLNTSTLALGVNGAEVFRVNAASAVGIGGIEPVASSILEVSSTTRGFLPPRMTTTQRDAISSPAEGLIIYNITTGKLNVRTASAWEAVTSL